jgi:hypothetical protein
MIDAPFVGQAEESRGLCEIGDLARVEADDAGAGGVDGDRIRAHRDEAHVARPSHDRPVTLHGRDRIDDRQMRPDGRVEIEDRVRDPFDVQHGLRPAVHGAGHRAEQVLHAARDSGPVMGLQLR